MSDPLRKCLSMGGTGQLRAEGQPHDYLLWGNREYILASGTTWVLLWVSWPELQPRIVPTSQTESWAQLNSFPPGQTPYLRRLDRQIKAINDDGLGVILALYQDSPQWANGAKGPDPSGKKTAGQHLPRDLSPNGPWGWFLAHVSARYDGSVNPLGPHDPDPSPTGTPAPATQRGNPDGARVHALKICNEANLLYWPQEGIAQRVVEMIHSADEISARWGGQRILAPGTLDSPDAGDRNDPTVRTDWQSFTLAVLDGLRGTTPRVPWSWALHNYRDVAYETTKELSRVRQVVEYLNEREFPGDRSVWIVEAGYNLPQPTSDPVQRERQANRIYRNFTEMRDLDGVFLWAQHGIHDVTFSRFKSALRDDFILQPPGPGARRPAWYVWKELPGSLEP